MKDFNPIPIIMTEELKKYLTDPDYIITIDGYIVTEATLVEDGVEIELLVGDKDFPFNMPFLLFPETYDGKTVQINEYDSLAEVKVFSNHSKTLAKKKAIEDAIYLINQIGWGYEGDYGVGAIIDVLEDKLGEIENS